MRFVHPLNCLAVREQLNHELYVKFWELQAFFCSPNQLYMHDKWTAFEKVTIIRA